MLADPPAGPVQIFYSNVLTRKELAEWSRETKIEAAGQCALDRSRRRAAVVFCLARTSRAVAHRVPLLRPADFMFRQRPLGFARRIERYPSTAGSLRHPINERLASSSYGS